MRRPEFIARQGRCPGGLLGSLLARIMALETAAANATALDLLELLPCHRVLEVGFGHGRTIAHAAARASQGFVAGVDPSERMLEMAARHNRRLIREGRVELNLGESSRLPHEEECFDRVYSVHTIYFWESPAAHLREIRRVMKAGARLVLGFRPKDERTSANFPSTVYRFYISDEVRRLLEAAGYEKIEIVEDRGVAFAVAHRAG